MIMSDEHNDLNYQFDNRRRHVALGPNNGRGRAVVGTDGKNGIGWTFGFLGDHLGFGSDTLFNN